MMGQKYLKEDNIEMAVLNSIHSRQKSMTTLFIVMILTSNIV